MKSQSTLLKNIVHIALGQGVSMALSLVIALIVPKILGVEQYGYWQLFMFYSSYAGLFLLGQNDGIYLLDAGRKYDGPYRSRLAKQAIIALVTQTVFCLIIVLLACTIIQERDRAWVVAAFGICMLCTNIQGLFGSAFQACNYNAPYAKTLVLSKGLYFVAVVVLLIGGCRDFRPYVVFYIAAQMAGLLYIAVKLRPVSLPSLKLAKGDIRFALEACKRGLPITISNIAGLLILGISRVAVDAFFDIEAFGLYSFAVSIMTFILSFVQQVSLVFFPSLVTLDREARAVVLKRLSLCIFALFAAIAVLLGPMLDLLRIWLADYAPIFPVGVIFIGVCVFESFNNAVFSTCIKLQGKERCLLVGNVIGIALCLGGCCACLALKMPLASFAIVTWLSVFGKTLFFYRVSRYRASAATILPLVASLFFLVAGIGGSV